MSYRRSMEQLRPARTQKIDLQEKVQSYLTEAFTLPITNVRVAKKYKLDFAQMSLKFLEIQPFVTSVIIGATTMEQLKTNIESVNINLTNEIINEIHEIQKIYPNPCP